MIGCHHQVDALDEMEDCMVDFKRQDERKQQILLATTTNTIGLTIQENKIHVRKRKKPCRAHEHQTNNLDAYSRIQYRVN